jgi:glycine C-acetyltransferase
MTTRDEFYKTIKDAAAPFVKPREITSGQGAYLTIDGEPRLNFCSSHYLGFAVNERVKQAAKDAIDKYGIGTGYRTLAGTHSLHLELEEAIAKFKGTDAAVVFSSAYAANSGQRRYYNFG